MAKDAASSQKNFSKCQESPDVDELLFVQETRDAR